MTGSHTINKISAALLKAQKKMGDATKGSKNPFYKSSYADLNSIRETVIPTLNEEGVTVLQPTMTLGDRNYVETILLHESGEWIAGLTQIVNVKGDAQSEGSGISYARRYGLQSICNVGAVDDDGEAANGRTSKQPNVVQQVPGPVEPKDTKAAVVSQAKKQETSNATIINSIGAPNATSQITTGSKDLITSAFKVLEAQGKITKETFKTNYLQGKGISTLEASELPGVYSKLLKDFPHLRGA